MILIDRVQLELSATWSRGGPADSSAPIILTNMDEKREILVQW